MAQLENIEAIEKRLWNAADTLRANSNYASNEYFMPVTIKDFLWDDRTGLPTPAYSEEDVKTKSRDVYRHVHRVYPTMPSPFYAS